MEVFLDSVHQSLYTNTMDLIKAGIGIGKTIRNMGRAREIATVFAKNGFGELLNTAVPGFVLPRSKRDIRDELRGKASGSWGQIIGQRLRLSFEELGPAYVKLGQLLASREDLFDRGFIDEMKLLQDSVKPFSWEQAESQLKTCYGPDLSKTFSSIEKNPIGAASISSVYRGVLVSGEDVVIKIKRPNIDRIIEIDFQILYFLLAQIEKVSDEIKYLGLSRVVKDFSVSIKTELNFNLEALNCDRLKENLSQHDSDEVFYIPTVYKEHCHESVMVMEFLDGIPFTNKEEVLKQRELVSSRLESGITLFLKTFLNDGFFHADLHGGNFFLLENSRIGLIDFGSMGTLSKKGRQSFIAIIYGLITSDYENLVYEFLDIAEYEDIPDVDALIRDVRDGLLPFVGLTVQQMNMSEVLRVVVTTLRTHKIYLPREWFIVFKAFISLDGVGKNLGIDFDVFTILEKDIAEIITESYSKEDILEELAWSAKDSISALKVIPRHLRWFLKDFAKRGYTFEVEHSGLDDHVAKLSGAIIFIGFCLLSTVFFGFGFWLLGESKATSFFAVPSFSWFFWMIGTGLVLRGYLFIRK